MDHRIFYMNVDNIFSNLVVAVREDGFIVRIGIVDVIRGIHTALMREHCMLSRKNLKWPAVPTKTRVLVFKAQNDVFFLKNRGDRLVCGEHFIQGFWRAPCPRMQIRAQFASELATDVGANAAGSRDGLRFRASSVRIAERRPDAANSHAVIGDDAPNVANLGVGQFLDAVSTTADFSPGDAEIVADSDAFARSCEISSY